MTVITPDYEELRRHAALMEILSEVSRVALEADDLETLLQRVVTFIDERLPVTIASIILLDETRTMFEKEVWAGSIDLQQPGEGGVWPVTVGLAGRCVRTGEPQLVLDVQGDPDYVPGNSTVASEYLVPIKYRGRILGVLNLESTTPEIFTDDAVRVFDSLADQVAGAVRLALLNEELEEANRRLETANLELQRLSMIDPLTGVANRRRFDQMLEDEWQRAARRGETVSVLLADADCFKRLNDASGHQVGDECLRRLAEVLAANVPRSTDLVARIGGEEFGVLLPNTELSEARRLADRLRASVEACAMTHPDSPVAPVVTVSIGIASALPRHDESAEIVMREADVALYRAKTAGRNRVIAARFDADTD